MERQSALHGRHLAAQGSMTTYAGWRLPASYRDALEETALVRTGAGISDASYLTKLDQRSSFAAVAPARVWQLTPGRSLITSPQPIAYEPSAAITDVTSVYSAILLAGPTSRALTTAL